MSEANRTTEEYIGMYAHDYCNDDTEKAKEHDVVKAVCETLKGEQENG